MNARKPHIVDTHSSGSTGSTRDLLADLGTGQEQRRARTARAALTQVDQRAELAANLTMTLDKQNKLSTEDRQALAQKILTAQIDELRAKLPQDQKVLAELLKELDDELVNIGGAFAEFQKHSPSEEALISDANQLVASTEGHVSLAKGKLAQLESAWFFKDSRSAKAKEDLAKAEADLVSAKLGVAQATDLAKNAMEKRLLSADFSVHYDRFTDRIKETCVVLEKSINGAWTNYNQVVEQLQVTHEDRTAASTAMEKLDELILAASNRLQQDQAKCDTLTAGSPERTAMEQSISEQNNHVQELMGKRNEALAIFQAKERATPELEVHRDTILAQYHVHRMNLASLRANSDSWRAAFDSRLEQMKGMSSIDASDKIDNVGAVLAKKGAENAAQTMMASVRQAVEMAEKHPERLEELLHVQGVQHQGMEELMQRMQTAMENSKNRGKTGEHSPTQDFGASGGSRS